MWQLFFLQAHPLNNFLIVPINVPEYTCYRSEIWLRANGIHTLQTAFAKHRHIGQTGKMISPSANSSYLLVLYGYNSFATKKKHRFVCLAKQYFSFNPFFTHSRNFLIWMYYCLLYAECKAFKFHNNKWSINSISYTLYCAQQKLWLKIYPDFCFLIYELWPNYK